MRQATYRLINSVAEIGVLPPLRALIMWIALIFLSWVLSVGLSWLLLLIFSKDSVFSLDLDRFCKEGSCFTTAISAEKCGDGELATRNVRPANKRVYWGACKSLGSAILIIDSNGGRAKVEQASSGALSVDAPKISDPPFAGGHAVVISKEGARGRASLSVKFYNRSAGDGHQQAKNWKLVSTSPASPLNPLSPAVAAPVPAEYLPVLVAEALKESSGDSGVDADILKEVTSELEDGIARLGLSSRTKGLGRYFLVRAFSGQIQSCLQILFFIFVIICTCRWLVYVVELSNDAAKVGVEPGLGDRDAKVKAVDDEQPRTDDGATDPSRTAWAALEVELRMIAERGESAARTARSPVSVVSRLARTAIAWRSRGAALSELPGLINVEQQSVEKMWEQEYQPLKYVLWALPTLGFVGTVVGVGEAMLATATLASPDAEVKMLGRGEVSAGIGVAFDTTLVALLLGMLAHLVFYDLVAREHSALESAKSRIVSLLAGLRSFGAEKDSP